MTDEENTSFETSDETKQKEFSEGVEKPRFDRPKECMLFEAKWESSSETIRTKTTKEGNVINLDEKDHYKNTWLKCTFKYKDEENEIQQFNQTYGNIREYKDRLWLGKNNRLSAFHKLAEAFLEKEIQPIWDLPKEVEGKQVKVKSEDYDFAGNTGFSNVVVDFVDSEKQEE